MADKKQSRTIEEAMKSLDAIVTQLESREISLEDSFKVYQEGMELLKYCNSKIDKVEKKMLQMDENGELSEF
ncbi:exodeoxyribonuclease VII small subunit [Lactonifactor longoviformis]|uniref:Exodeoxyribonuclease 7 small subunit n=1 Tax=Lactonifactor longoviformis DSM 17459 TaxID=1122155 RepID=A0A1M4VIV4_9CLOT|nr:exodeoxyribonuclease VII small subunit [Lactonifactor longoviformis]POP32234.1 exodeoxyribonuclease VII small subunit [Lactonifactor longoviformis]SHE68793.1 Exodeoxyribonuclease VII small subunit [Lactonifactor longoviformis DSM 17459]